MEKLKVSQELSEVLESAITLYGINHLFVIHCRKKESNDVWDSPKYKPLNSLTIEQMYRALHSGVSLKKTPEEEVLTNYLKNNTDSDFDLGYRQGVAETLFEYGIKIKGINS